MLEREATIVKDGSQEWPPWPNVGPKTGQACPRRGPRWRETGPKRGKLPLRRHPKRAREVTMNRRWV